MAEESPSTGQIWYAGDRNGTVSGDVNYPLAGFVILGTDVSRGELTLNPDGTFEYVPLSGFEGIDQFTFFFLDGGTLREVVVTIIVGTPGGSLVFGDDTSELFPGLGENAFG